MGAVTALANPHHAAAIEPLLLDFERTVFDWFNVNWTRC
jgi:hypothetical protein